MKLTHVIHLKTRWQQHHQQMVQSLWHLFWWLWCNLISTALVLTVCGFANVADHMSVINNEGFQSMADFGVLDDKDVFEMVKQVLRWLYGCSRSCECWSNSGEKIASSLLLGM
jgi:hypothetical protein